MNHQYDTIQENQVEKLKLSIRNSRLIDQGSFSKAKHDSQYFEHFSDLRSSTAVLVVEVASTYVVDETTETTECIRIDCNENR
jgi:hypothetical protein